MPSLYLANTLSFKELDRQAVAAPDDLPVRMTAFRALARRAYEQECQAAARIAELEQVILTLRGGKEDDI